MRLQLARPSGHVSTGHLDEHGRSRYTLTMRFYGLLDTQLLRVIELQVSRTDVERVLNEILNDEPDWADRYTLAAVELGNAEPTVELL